MTRPQRQFLYSVVCLICVPLCCFSQKFHLNLKYIQPDTLCVVADSCRLYFPRDHQGVKTFYNKLQKQLMRGTNRINVLHIGGSHVQAGYLTAQMRENLSGIRDSFNQAYSKPADRGVIFPFRSIRTNGPTDYSTDCTGQWGVSKCLSPQYNLELGISGAAMVTTDTTASVSLTLHDDVYSFNKLHVLGYSTSPGTYPIISIGTDTLYPSIRNKQGGFLFHLPAETTNCTLSLVGVNENNPFVLRGMIPLSDRDGITYTEAGINGASVPSWLNCEALEKELRLLPPDLVIFGIGINDAATSYDNFSPEVFKDNYRNLIERILKVNPKTALLFITNNDCNQTMRSRRPNLNTPRAEQAFKELAEEYNGCVFNLFQIMGGQGSAANWVSNGLMQSDRVHFTAEGYRLVADLLYNALITDFTAYCNGTYKTE